MSGFGAPARTATPMPDLASRGAVPAATLPCLIKSSSSVLDDDDQVVHFARAIRFMMSTVPAQVVVTLWPVARSNCGTSSR